MTLREELEDRADKLDAELLDLSGRIKEIERQSNELHTCLNALDIAEMDAEDAALEPAPIVNTDEGWELEPAPEPQPEAVTDEWHEDFLQLTDEPDDEATRAAAIELTADVEPEIQALIESGEHSYDEVAAIAYPEPEWNEPQTEGYAPVVDNAEAHIQAVEAERYALATNPEADALAKAHDYYSPEKVAERNRFNPWGIFKREPEEVS